MLSPRMRARNSVSAISLRKTHKNPSHFTARHHSSGFWRAFPPPVRMEGVRASHRPANWPTVIIKPLECLTPAASTGMAATESSAADVAPA